ncbi:MAG: SpoIIE family protein phosphatase [Solirubrobacterales bacterium]
MEADELAPGEPASRPCRADPRSGEDLPHARRRDGYPEAGQLADDPSIPQRGFSRASRTISALVSGSSRGRPGPGLGSVQRRATRRRCQIEGRISPHPDCHGVAECHSVRMAAGDPLALCTDGCLETGPPARHQGAEAFGDAVAGLSQLGPAELTARLREDVLRRSAGSLRDDVVVLAVRAASPGAGKAGGQTPGAELVNDH